jgi:hypothetical protein
MRIATIVIALLVIAPITATAEVFSWRDADGKMHYSDRPSMDPGVDSRRIGAPTDASDDVPTAVKNAADRKDEAAKQTKEAGEKAAKEEQQRTSDAQRQENCERARQNLEGIESGIIRFRMTESGEREGLDGAARDAELANARQMVEANCAPRPAAK